MGRSLSLTLKLLHGSAIPAGARITPARKLEVWLGDAGDASRTSELFELHQAAAAADWLTAMAVRRHPKSDIARVHQLVGRAAAAVAQLAGDRWGRL